MGYWYCLIGPPFSNPPRRYAWPPATTSVLKSPSVRDTTVPTLADARRWSWDQGLLTCCFSSPSHSLSLLPTMISWCYVLGNHSLAYYFSLTITTRTTTFLGGGVSMRKPTNTCTAVKLNQSDLMTTILMTTMMMRDTVTEHMYVGWDADITHTHTALASFDPCSYHLVVSFVCPVSVAHVR